MSKHNQPTPPINGYGIPWSEQECLKNQRVALDRGNSPTARMRRACGKYGGVGILVAVGLLIAAAFLFGN
jgi:hypothetical protein